MAFSENLDCRISAVVADLGTERRKMFGGTCHLLNGNMMCGVWQNFLILRLGREQSEAALALPEVREFDITGRSMGGWVMVESAGYAGDGLEKWLAKAHAFASTLPPK